jgi:hypothetical protein
MVIVGALGFFAGGGDADLGGVVGRCVDMGREILRGMGPDTAWLAACCDEKRRGGIWLGGGGARDMATT